VLNLWVIESSSGRLQSVSRHNFFSRSTDSCKIASVNPCHVVCPAAVGCYKHEIASRGPVRLELPPQRLRCFQQTSWPMPARFRKSWFWAKDRSSIVPPWLQTNEEQRLRSVRVQCLFLCSNVSF
jgi:hypothetical protein